MYHGLARSLEGGYHSRPGLPVELVIYIFRLADCVLPSERFTMKIDIPCRAKASSGTISNTIWFSTPPLSREPLSRIASIQLVTLSRDQGWCGDPSSGSWSWFEIVILRGDSQQVVKKSAVGGKDLVWISHHNPIASKQYSWLEGSIFGSDHELWKHLAEGDRIAVRACAQYGGWCCSAMEGFLKADEWFEPTLPPISIRNRET